jgi:membrane-associated protease RseP (regulator of RpoE activity)
VDKGVYLADLIEGRGAQLAGLQIGDLITKLGSSPVYGIETLLQILAHQKMGSQVEVEFYHGSELHTVSLELMPLPIPVVPDTHLEMVAKLEEIYTREYQELRKVLAEINEAAASWKPAPREWSVKEILAHLINTERDNQVGLHFNLMDMDFDWVDNIDERGLATLAAYPTVQELADEAWRSMVETLNFVKVLPESFRARKGSYWRMAQDLLTADAHIAGHTGQILSNLEKFNNSPQA